MANRRYRVDQLECALADNDWVYALRLMCDIARDDRSIKSHADARAMIDRACGLVANHPEVPFTALHFDEKYPQDLLQVYCTWRDFQDADKESSNE